MLRHVQSTSEQLSTRLLPRPGRPLCPALSNFTALLSSWSCGVVVITSALHAEGPQFDPGRDQMLFFIEILKILNY